MRKLLLVLVLIAIVACDNVKVNSELIEQQKKLAIEQINAIFKEVKLRGGIDWDLVWNIVKAVGCAAAPAACCTSFPEFCVACSAIIAGICAI